jgi:hypothetical protein
VAVLDARGQEPGVRHGGLQRGAIRQGLVPGRHVRPHRRRAGREPRPGGARLHHPARHFALFPLVDNETSTIEGNGTTEADLRDLVGFFSDFIDPDSLFCEIDGKSVWNLTDYRVQSPLFTFGPLPDNNVLQSFGVDAPEGSTSPAVSDGVFVMLKPLSVGKHTLHYGGTLDLSSIGGPVFIQDVTYHITVKR